MYRLVWNFINIAQLVHGARARTRTRGTRIVDTPAQHRNEAVTAHNMRQHSKQPCTHLYTLSTATVAVSAYGALDTPRPRTDIKKTTTECNIIAYVFCQTVHTPLRLVPSTSMNRYVKDYDAMPVEA